MNMVTYRKNKTIFNRVFALLTVLAVAVLSAIAGFFAFGNTAHAEGTEQGGIALQAEVPSHDSVFGANHGDSKEFSLSDKEVVHIDDDSYYLMPGTFHLSEDLVLSKSLDMSSSVLKYDGLITEDSITVNFCLHGHSILMSQDYNAFNVYSSSTLNLFDCGGADNCGTISGGYGVSVAGTCNMYGGVIKDGDGLNTGVSVTGEFNMYDGKITGNYSSGTSGNGGGVFIGSGTFNMYGGEISNNTSKGYGGAGVQISQAGSVFHMYGGSIINNVLDCSNAYSDDSIPLFYYGAGVKFGTGTFSIEGDVNISGNVRQYKGKTEINNLGIKDGCKFDVTGKLGPNAKIGISASKGVISNGYTTAGNTEAPSKYFILDTASTDLAVGLSGGEVAVVDSNDSSIYTFDSAEVTGVAAAKAGNTELTLTIEATLKNSAGDTKIIPETKVVKLSQPLHAGPYSGTYEYTYDGVKSTLPYSTVVAKYGTFVVWSISGTQRGQNEYRRVYDGTDVSNTVHATYKDYYGENVSISGMTDQVVLQNSLGNKVESTAMPGTYYFHLVESDDYAFDNNTLTLEVVASDSIIYEMKDAVVKGVKGTPSVGDTTIRVELELTLVDPDDNTVQKKQTVEYTVTPSAALKVGSNTVNFKYTYGTKSKDLSVTFDVSKKHSNITWSYNGAVVGSTLKHVYDGVDAGAKIIATYDAIDGTRKRVAANSKNMIRKDANGNEVTSLKDIGVYTLSLAELADYEFGNNSFTYEVVEKPEDLSDLNYKENGIVIMGVSIAGGSFENGTELVLEKTTVANTGIGGGTVNTAYNVKFVKGSETVKPTGTFTVNVLIPSDLTDKTYEIYNLKGKTATKLQYTPNGNYATFEAKSLDCIVFVLISDEPPVVDDPPVDDPDDPNDPNDPDDPNDPNDPNGDRYNVALDDGGLTWLWVVLAIILFIIILVIVLVAVAKRKNKAAASDNKANKPADTDKQNKPEKPTKRCNCCGRENDEDSTFCIQCGKEFE